jgi:D-alanine-D-alanine ligase
MDKILENFKKLAVREKKGSLKVGVIAGGISSEREVSLETGKGIYKSLLAMGYNTVFIDLKDDFISKLKSINLAFIALHGKYGEDGTVQGLLELLKISYTGSGVMSSAMAMDKTFSKKIFKYEKINTPSFIEASSYNDSDLNKIDKEIKKRIIYPVIIKPNRGGSTIGVSIVYDKSELSSGIKTAFNFDSKILIEKYIDGRLLTVSIIAGKPFTLPIIEIKPKSGFYDYKSKYTKGLTEYIVPAKLEKSISEEITNLALKSHRSLDCWGISRVDFILGDDKKIYVLEVNTIPGMTPTSLVPKAAEAAGISFDLLVEIVLNFASLKV